MLLASKQIYVIFIKKCYPSIHPIIYLSPLTPHHPSLMIFSHNYFYLLYTSLSQFSKSFKSKQVSILIIYLPIIMLYSSNFDLLDAILYGNPFEGTFPDDSHTQIETKSLQSQQERVYMQKWSVQENQAYLKFLIRFSDDFRDQWKRRSSRVFKRLSSELKGKRDPEQCRGHHKKLLKSHKNLDGIIKQLRVIIAKKRRKLNMQCETKKREHRIMSNKFEDQAKKMVGVELIEYEEWQGNQSSLCLSLGDHWDTLPYLS